MSENIYLDKDLSKKVSKGVLWVTVSSISARVLNIISAIILARILMPEDFGLMAIAISIISFSQGTTQTGFESALIQRQNDTEKLLNTAWTTEFLRNFIIFLLIILLAPQLASFFNEPRAVLVLRVIGLSILFQGMRNIGVVYFRKNLDFKKQFILEMVPLVIYITAVIPLSFLLRNVWALVMAHLASNIGVFLVSYIVHPYRPRFEFNKEKAKDLFHFGKWILGSSILVMIRDQGVNMFVGKFLGIPMLGFFNRASAFSTVIFQQVSEVVWKVGYPAFSQLQGNTKGLNNAYLKTLQLLTFIGIPMAGGLFILSEDFVHLVLTDKWIFIVPLIQILCLTATLGFINTPASIVFQATGRPSIVSKMAFIGVVILVLTIYPLSLIWGISGVLISILLGVLIPTPFIWHLALKITKSSTGEFLKTILIPIMNSGIMILFICIIKNSFNTVGYIEFFSLILAGIISYLSLSYFVDRWFKYGIYCLIMQRINALR